ncbi:MAG: ribulose-phosphate 3-epimerase [Bacilli bacterium]
MKKPLSIAPSLLSADFAHLADEINRVSQAGLHYLHFDVMDGHFVPNISFGVPILKAINRLNSGLINDVHLMISDPLKYAPDFIKAGADIITFHVEACATHEEVISLINLLKKAKVQIGVSLKPATPVQIIERYLAMVDLVLVMSVEPGFGGQEFMPNALEKIRELVKIKQANDLHFVIEVDGGINEVTAPLVRAAGVDIIVAGSYLFGHTDFKKRVELLQNDE